MNLSDIKEEAKETFEAQVLAHMPVSLEIGGEARKQLRRFAAQELDAIIDLASQATRERDIEWLEEYPIDYHEVNGEDESDYPSPRELAQALRNL